MHLKQNKQNNESIKESLIRIKPKNKIQKSFINGIVWCINFLENERYFNSQAINYVLLLHGLCFIKKDRETDKLLLKLLQETIERISKKMDIIVKKDNEEILYILSSFGKLKDLPKEVKLKIQRYYKSIKCKEIYENDIDETIENEDYDSLSDEAVSHVFLSLAKKYNKEIKSFPVCRLDLYKKALNKFNIQDLEKTTDDYNELDYHVTHVLFIYNSYNCTKLKRNKTVKSVENYLVKNSRRILTKSKDIDLIAEVLDCMLVINNRNWNKTWKSKFVNKLLKKQNKSGMWSTKGDKTIYVRFHGNWACLGALYQMF